MNWYLKVLKQYADFNGRARRKEYWMFVLFDTIFSIVAITMDYILELEIVETEVGIGYGFLSLIYALAIFIPKLAVAVRRLHDIGKSGWMILISLFPLIGWVWFLILMVTDGDYGENEYGQNPKEVTIKENLGE